MENPKEVGVVQVALDEVGPVALGADQNIARAVIGTTPGDGKGVGLSRGIGGGEKGFRAGSR